MKCPYCQQEVAPESKLCPLCGGSLTVPPPPVAGVKLPSPALRSEPSAGRKVAFVVISVFCWIFILFLNIALTKAQFGDLTSQNSGYFVGSCIGALLLSGIIVWAINKFGRKQWSGSTIFFLISVVALGFTFMASAQQLPKLARQRSVSPQRVGQLAKEAVGQAPVTPDESVWDGPIRSFFADIKAFNDQYTQEAAAVDKSAFKSLYGAESFQSREAMERMLSQMQAVRDVDARHESLDPLFEKLKARIWAVDAPESEKKAFWEGFENSARQSMAPRTAASQKGIAWMDASIELYQFTLANEDSFSVQGGKLFFKQGSGLDKEFNEKVQKALALRKEFLTQQEAFHADQRQKLGQFGVTPSDMGIKPQDTNKQQ